MLGMIREEGCKRRWIRENAAPANFKILSLVYDEIATIHKLILCIF